MIEIADHLTQFASIETVPNDTRNETFYRRDYTKWNDQQFLDDLSIQPWITSDNPDLKFKDILWRLEGSIDRHAPLKKTK